MVQADRQSARQIAKDNLDIEMDTAKAAIKLFQLLLKKLRELLLKNPTLEQNQSPLTIEVNGKEYYQAQLGQPPTLDRLTPQQIKYLQQAVSYPPQKQLDHKPDIEIKAKDLVLFKAENGIVQTNQIYSAPVQQNAQIIDAEIVNDSPQKKLEGKNPALLPEKGASEVVLTATKLVGHLGKDYGERKTFQGQSYDITLTKPQSERGHELTIFAKDGRGEILRFNNQEVISNLQPSDLNKFAQIERELTQDLARQKQLPSHQSSMNVNESNQQQAQLQVAKTAFKLVEQLGQDYGSHKVFEGKSYTIAQLKPDPQMTRLDPDIKGQLSVIAKDGRGEILRFNNQEVISNLQPSDLNKFTQIERELTQDLSQQKQLSPRQEPSLER